MDAEIFTDRLEPSKRNEKEHILGLPSSDMEEISQESYTTPNGLETAILSYSYRAHRGRDKIFVASFSLNGVPFIARAESFESIEEVREILLQVLDGFMI